MKIKIYLCVMLLLLSTALVSCTKEETEVYVEDEYEPEKITESVSADLLFIGWENIVRPSNASQVENMLELLNQAIAEEFNMDINIEWVRERDYSENILERIASGTPPDAIEVYFSHATYYSLAPTGELLDIGEMFAEHMPNTYAQFQKNYPDFLETMKYDGANYILPSLRANPVRHCIVTTKAMYDEYGKDVETIEDYEKYMQWISVNYPDMIPGYGNMHYIYEAYLSGKGYFPVMLSIYVNIGDRGIKAVPVEELEEFTEVYNMLSRWDENEYFGDLSYPTFQTAANYGQLASFLINTRDTNFRKDIAMMPTDREYEYLVLYPDTKIVARDPQNGMVFAKNSDAAERIMQFIEWMYEDRQCYDIFHYGEEGVNYNIKDGKLFLNMNQNVNTVLNWWGSVSISNYHMERPIWSEPANYTKFVEGISFANTVSQKQVLEKAGVNYNDAYRAEDGSQSMVSLMADIEPLMEERSTAYTQFIRGIIQYNFTRSADEVIELLRNANGQKLADAFNNTIGYLKDN